MSDFRAALDELLDDIDEFEDPPLVEDGGLAGGGNRPAGTPAGPGRDGDRIGYYRS